MIFKIIPLSSSNFNENSNKLNSKIINENTLKTHEKMASEDTIMHRVGIATADGKIVGFGMGVSGSWDPILLPGHFDISIHVDIDWINQGIGSMLLEEVTRFAKNNGGTVVQCGISESALNNIAWLEKRGFTKVFHTFESQLDLSTFNIDHYKNIFENEKLNSVEFKSFAEYPQDDIWLQRFFDFWWELAKDAPGMEGKTKPDIEVLKNQFEGIDREGFILAIEGDSWIAMSMIINESSEIFYNSLTGVQRSYRGKGIALALKLKSINYAKQKGAKLVRTHNASNNIPILNINRKLGYEKQPGIYFFEKHI
ncbi:GNAT family N-acetyltransferase [Sporosarcina sp. Te-1]|uniref:GNAT family N-acetyltransferase n=1 Tax=Sporosarcina sp. Te-1 TaxID=2818390 RepID=UPI001A9E1334|nr:GNAT family N-acetyltransferase [Sporosarcina sp. Te-1]QTD39771.1 GNAT family N-acetyltransferase [Sporosarcina sp. Te-1]